MILTRIQIENYKQYTGAHEIEIPAQATVGVIGENGSGKTTPVSYTHLTLPTICSV